MAEGEFKITEYPVGSVDGDSRGESFVWTACKEGPSQGSRGSSSGAGRDSQGRLGGARAAPVGPWDMTGKLHTVRTDYPGARIPSEQVLYAAHEPFTWTGRWDDRYNYAGYAKAEKQRFEEMCRRGNPVKFEYQVYAYWGIITNWKFSFRRRWDIGYTFTVSVHSIDGENKLDRSPVVQQQPEQALDDIDILAAATAKAHSEKPAWATSTPLVSNVSQALGKVSERINAVANALSTSQGVLKPISDAKNLALQFRALQGECSNVVLQLVTARSDLDMGVRTAKAVLDFEAWSRNTKNLMRLTMGRSKAAADDMDRRDIPSTKAIYRPRKGESLYAISRKAYGTPNAWHTIMRANHLTTLVMAGTETLTIPAAGEV